ncbi:amino acid transporter [Basidiobolus meristosporus CBS 931.73]|uniref:Amino acid transporter n=1 Tax=Basidiobolus meristosporus CBS 931.73 TaxID=1314790 RepID=A0A1Y1YWD8_9FUNG|nr:amino acid transporter [Basidiobolus meristosporus CBS 931.73]|eukprot:ORY01875.1 amino acid transporter [Basidiobolus meristosporus CBS 931.73]
MRKHRKKPWWLKPFTVRSIEQTRVEAAHSEMKRTLNILDLVSVGIGASIGMGIFTFAGIAAATKAGPSIVVSFVISGIAAAFTALSYSEMASMIPMAGSAYTYTCAAMGEFIAWIIGWNLILEYMVGAATVSIGWSAYFIAFLEIAFNCKISTKWVNSPVAFFGEAFITTGNYLNLPAIAVSLVFTILLCFDIRQSTRVNAVLVVVKVLTVLLTIFTCIKYINPDNYTPFFPPNEGEFGKYGISGTFSAATTVFFTYIGFDVVSSTSQEAKNPQRDLPIGILGSLLICTFLNIAVGLVMTGVVPYGDLHPPGQNAAKPIAILIATTGLNWLNIVVSLGTIFGSASVVLILLMGQSRILNAMAIDGFFPEVAARIHPKYKTPWFTTILSGVLCALLGGVLPVDVLGDMTSVGTLFAFFLVNINVIILRFKYPGKPRRFKVPLGPFVIPILGAGISVLLFCTIPASTIVHFFIWMGIGVVIYAFYGCSYTRINILHVSGYQTVKEST